MQGFRHQIFNDGKAEAGPSFPSAGSKKRLEHMIKMLGGDATAKIAHNDGVAAIRSSPADGAEFYFHVPASPTGTASLVVT